MRDSKRRFKKIVALVLCLGLLTGMLDGVPMVGKYSMVAEAADNLVWPVPGHTGLSRGYHDGKAIDICDGTIAGATVVAAYSGVVTHKFVCSSQHFGSYGECKGFGNGIVIKGYDGRIYQYAHMQANSIPSDVYVGATIRAGQKIGCVGTTGNSSGNHLHFGISYNGYWIESGIDPSKENYIYDTSISNSQTVQSPSIRNADYYFSKTETTFKCRADFSNPQRKLITDLGIALYDENGNEIDRIHEKEDKKYGVGSNNPEKYIFYDDVASELGFPLNQGTTYQYRFFIQVSGSDLVYSPVYTLITDGDSTPKTPSLSVDTTHIAAGKSVTVKWNADSNATNGYDITVSKTDGSYTRTINVADKNAGSAMVAIPSEGSYKITAIAKGASKNSDVATLSQLITAHGQSTVTFVQQTEEGEELLKTEKVDYGDSATAPTAPSREGYTFQGWDKSYNNVTSDLKITAKYKINTYTVKFVDEDGTVLKEQKAEYKSKVEPPADPTSKKEGYVFGGWDKNTYECVKENTTINASYIWANNDLPVIVHINSCEYKESGYLLTYSITNYNVAKTTGRAIVSLKTSTGKLVATTESNAFTLEKSATKSNQEIFIPYEGAASTAEIVIVNSFSSGIPISKNDATAVTREWSTWQETVPEGNYEVESRTEYRYMDKVTTSSSASSLSGWTLYDTTWYWSDWGNWSSWSRNEVGGSDYRQVETQNVTDSNAYTNYKYYYWRRNRDGNLYSYNQYANYTYYEYNTSSPLKWCKTVDGGVDGYVAHSGYINFSNELWYLASTTNVPATSHTEWRYRDRSQNYIYYYYKWNDWSSWSVNPVTANDNRKVETRTTYRYKATVSGEEDNSGTLREVTGSVPTELAGKQATLLVYKNEEAADYNNEYVGQKNISEDGTFDFSFFTREEPSAQTGDFTVYLAVEGATNPIYLQTIKAPLPTYTVTYVDWDGTEISRQQVVQGETASLPENPSREHYRFMGWDTGNTNVRSDMIITAQYEKETYTVVWVDWSRQNFAIDSYTYDDELLEPSLEEVEGYELVGWTDENGEVPEKVTRNLILTAEYKIKEYSVKFYDWEGNVISSQMVEYGKAALIPESPRKEGMIFNGWSSSEHICVKSNLDIYPNFAYIETVENPTVDKASGAYSHEFSVKLSAEDGADIYYTTDGTTPDQYSKKYDNNLTIDKNTILQFVACKEGKNTSEIQRAVYLISETEDSDGVIKIKKVPDELETGATTPLEYTFIREEGTKNVKFFSLDENVVTIDAEGNIYAVNSGSTEIFVVSKDLKYADYCTVSVVSNEISVTGIVLENSILCISPEQSTKIEATIEPANATYQDISWYSSDNQIVTVGEDGKITGKTLGSASLRGYSYTGNCYIDCTVVVAEPFVGLSDSAVAMEAGEELSETPYMIGSIEQKFTWSSSEEEIATVNEEGLIKAIAPGQATISYTSEDGKYQASMLVIVTEKKNTKISLENAVISKISDATYTGESITSEVKVMCNGVDLKKDQDFNLVFNNNVECGTATVYVIGINAYTGMAQTSFTILPKDISTVKVNTLSAQKYTGSAITPVLIVKDEGITLSEGIDYTLSYDNNIQPGTATYTISGNGNYSGILTGNFEIVNEETTKPTITPTSTTTPTPSLSLTQKPTATPKVTEKATPTPETTQKATPTPGTTQKATATPRPTEKATVTPTPGTTQKATPTPVKAVKAPSKPVIKSVTNKKGKKMVVKLKAKVKGAKGYQLTYATNSRFTQAKKSVDMGSTSKTITKLKKGKTYYVKVRAYTKDSKGKKVYGKYSNVKKVKIQK